MSEWLQREWYRASGWQVLLRPLSWLFYLLSSVRRLAYRAGWFPTYRLPVPVVVVGNITVGGTGKTPLVIWLAQQFQAQGFHPGIISRGYGGKRVAPVAVSAESDPASVGDEPVMIAGRTSAPVIVARDRVAAGHYLLEIHPECDVIISDDGLQHYRLARDAEIIVVDGARRFGNGQLLPAGPLRERVERIQSANAVVCNGAACLAGAVEMTLYPTMFRNLKNPGKVASPTEFIGKKVLAIAGIGNPERFFMQLNHMGLQCASRAFPDHHAYVPADLPIHTADAILMTEKDAVKCRAFAQENWWYLEVEASLDPALAERLGKTLRK